MSDSWSDLLMLDHQTTEQVFEAVGGAFRTSQGPAPEMIRNLVLYLTKYVDGCHNRKEEDHLFPLIERRGIPRAAGPLAVMLSEHEQSRQLLARLVPLATRYAAGDRSTLEALEAVFDEYSTLLKNHFWKENDILYPMARRVMSEEDARAVASGIEATEAALGPDTRGKYYALARRIGQVDDLSFGVERDVLAAILNTLPIELSFVDHNDLVRYFSHENSTKIFPRSRGVIGTPVQQCHPQASVDKVNAILEAFKAGTRKVAEFWIDLGGKKIHIRYFPVHSPEGKYLGCLETVQDITAIQELTGQRRLLNEEGQK
jgi:hypothetical protein